MSQVKLKGNIINTIGSLPAVGSQAPDFRLTNNALENLTLKDFAGKKLVLSINPSIDTGVCATTLRKFNQEASELVNTVVVGVTMDTPFALKRYCGAEGIEKVITTSLVRDPNFGSAYGVRIMEGGLEGLMSRSIVIINESGKVIYTEQVPETTQEPDYAAALSALKK
jgi:thiol peroxidase